MAILQKKQETAEVRGDPRFVAEELRAIAARIHSLATRDPAACLRLLEDQARFIYENERWPEDFFALLRVYQRCWPQAGRTEPFEDAVTAMLKKNGIPAVMATLLRGSDSSIAWNADYFKDLALVSEGREEFETALSYADLAVKIDPSNAQVCVVRGWVLLDLGCNDDAVVMFLRAYELNPRNHAANNALAKHFAATNTEKALEFADRAIEIMPGEGSYHATKAKILSRTGDMDGAMACLDLAILAAPYDAEFLFEKGELLLADGKDMSAAATYRKALALNERHIPCLERLVQLYERTEPELALAYANTICTLEAENTRIRRTRAKLLQRLGENKAAELQYEELVEMEPRDAESLCGLGWLALLEDPEAAIPWFERAIIFADTNAMLFECHMGKGRAHEELGQNAQSIKEYKTAAAHDREKAAPLARLAFLHEQTAPRTAEDYYEKAIALAPENVFYMTSLGELLLARGENDRAMKLLSDAVKLDPANPRLRVLMGGLLEQGGSAASALEHYRAAVNLEPTSPGVATAYASIAKLIADTDPGSALMHINSAISLDPKNAGYCHRKAKVLLALGENRQAILALQEALKADNKNTEVLGELAQILEADSPKLAMHYLNRAAELAPKNVQYLSARAELLIGVGEVSKARTQLEDILRRDAKHPAALFGMARCHANDNPVKALGFVDRAIAADNSVAEYHAMRAGLLPDRKQALAAIDRAITLDSSNAGFLLQKAQLLADDGQPSAAMECLRRTLAIEQGNIAARRQLGFLLMEAEVPAAALEHLNIAIDADPDDAVLRARRAQALASMGRSEEAAQDYSMCVQLGGGGPDVLFTLAEVLSATLPETALGFCLRAVESGGDKPELFLLLGKLQDSIGQRDLAADAYKRAKQADPKCHEAAERLAAITGEPEDVDDALKSSPGCAVCLLRKAKLLLGSDDAVALACLQRAAKSDPESLEICEMSVYLLEKRRSVVRLALERRRLAKLRREYDES